MTWGRRAGRFGGMKRTPRIATLAVTLAPIVALLSVGCQSGGATDLNRENGRLKEQVADRDRQIVTRDATIQGLNEQLRVARAIKPDDLRKIFYPETISIERLTGGYNDDGKQGDDGIVVYVQPVDRDGDALKVAGDIRVELFDLEASGDRLVGTTVVPVDKVAALWYGKFNTYHYTIKCPWSAGAPKHSEITVRVTFVDFLTQRVMTNQVVCKVALPVAP